MCGILYAKMKIAPEPTFSAIFKEALALMTYRGRDNTGYFELDNNFFGHTRLSIVDPSAQSNQPIILPNSIMIFKGEIYNYKQLSPEAQSDTLAIASLIERDIDIENKLAGMYSIVVYDKRSHEVKILRDFYGEKPIYYYQDENIFIASSTLKSIVYLLEKQFSLQLQINSLSVGDYLLSGYIREPKTIYAGIHTLSSGHKLTLLSSGQIKVESLVQELLDNAVLNPKVYAETCMQTSDVKPTLLLSAGVDSTYLLSLMKNIVRSFKVLTYKSPSASNDESSKAVASVKKIFFSTAVQVNVVENHESICQLYKDYVAMLEQPTSDGLNLFNILLLNRNVDKESKLVLLGTGGDELYGGYPSFKNWRFVAIVRSLPFLKFFLSKKYRRFFKISTEKKLAIKSYYFLYRSCHQALNILSNSILKQLFDDFVQEMQKYELVASTNSVQKVKVFETFDYMRNQLLRDSDNTSLFCGYEARNPLLAVSAYEKKPDFKKNLKNILKDLHGVTFGKKQGFSLMEDGSSYYYEFLCENILLLNKKYNLLPEKLVDMFLSLPARNILLVRKIYILLSWLNVNKITPARLPPITERSV